MLTDIKLIDVVKFENFGEIKIGDMLSYKNKMFININFIPIFKDVQFLKEMLFEEEKKQSALNDNINQGVERQSSESDEDDQEIDEDDELDKTFAQLDQYKYNKKLYTEPISLIQIQNLNRNSETE